MKKFTIQRIFCVFIIISLNSLLFSQNSLASSANASTEREALQFSIRFFDKQIYYAGSDIKLKLTLTNRSPETFRFMLAEDKLYTVRFVVKTLSNRILEPSMSFQAKLAANQQIFYRELALKTDEEYSFDVLLNDFINVTEAGSFLIEAAFFPELVRGNSEQSVLASNILTLSVRPGSGISPVKDRIELATQELLRAQKISPDEVINRTLIARQKERWNEFFLYIDLEQLLLMNTEQKKKYERSGEEARIRMLSEYKTELMKKVTDTDIVIIPASFKIIKTQYQQTSGTVVVEEKFDSFLDERVNSNFYLVKEYTYKLEKKDDIWYIVSYTVINKGTENKKAE